MGNKLSAKLQYLKDNYKEIIIQRSRMIWQRFPEAVFFNLANLVYQGYFLLMVELDDLDEDWFLWTERLLSMLLVAVAAELWRERKGNWQPGKYRWKIWSMLLGWGLILEAGTRLLPEFERLMFHLVTPGFWLCLIIYLLLPKDKEKQSGQLRSFMYVMATAGVMGGLVSILLGICLTAVSVLLLPIPTEVHIFLLGVLPFAFAVNVLLSLLSTEDKEQLVSDSLMTKASIGLVFPCYVFLLVVLYLYIGKIIMLQAMPIGEMNWYASLALLGYGFFYFFWNDIRKPWFEKFMRWGLVLFLPILIVQFYGIWIRYEAYGLTTLRYASMICTACGICLLVFRFLRRGMRPLFLLGAVLLIVFSISPLNIMRVPLHNQQARLISLLEQEGLYEDGKIVMSHGISEERTPAIKSCVDYIRSNSFVKNSNEEFCQQVKEIKWKSYYYNGKPDDVKEKKKTPVSKVVFMPRQKGIPVAGYRTAYPFTIKRGVAVVQLEDGNKQKVDIHDYVKGLMSAHKDVTGTQNVFLEDEYLLEDKSRLYFTELTVQMPPKSTELAIYGRGYLLQK